MRKRLAKKGRAEPDVKEIKKISDQVAKTHQRFLKHIETHDCWPTRASAVKTKKGKRK